MCDFFKQNFYVREIFELIIECNETGNYEILKEIEFDVPDYLTGLRKYLREFISEISQIRKH